MVHSSAESHLGPLSVEATVPLNWPAFYFTPPTRQPLPPPPTCLGLKELSLPCDVTLHGLVYLNQLLLQLVERLRISIDLSLVQTSKCAVYQPCLPLFLRAWLMEMFWFYSELLLWIEPSEIYGQFQIIQLWPSLIDHVFWFEMIDQFFLPAWVNLVYGNEGRSGTFYLNLCFAKYTLIACLLAAGWNWVCRNIGKWPINPCNMHSPSDLLVCNYLKKTIALLTEKSENILYKYTIQFCYHS